jgi:hypothetical protein
MLHRVRLKVRIAIVIRTMVKRERNRISPEMLAMPAFLKRIDFSAWTAYTSGLHFAKAFSHPGKLSMG